MCLLPLPPELFVLLATFLEAERDLNSLSRTCHRLYALLNTYLYRRNAQNSKSSALLWAARCGNEETARKSIQEGASIQEKDSTDRTPLCWAAENGHKAIVKLLLENGKSIVNRSETIESADVWFTTYPGEDFTGEVVNFAENGTMTELTNYCDGVLCGWEYEWFRDGTKSFQGCRYYWGDVGEWYYWFPNGQLQCYKVFDDSGMLLKCQCWNKAGELVNNYVKEPQKSHIVM